MSHTSRTEFARALPILAAIACCACSTPAMGKPSPDQPPVALGACDVICPGGMVVSRDVNGDGFVNLPDLGIFAATFNKKIGDVGFNAKCDFNCDGVVNLTDMGIFADAFNKAC